MLQTIKKLEITFHYMIELDSYDTGTKGKKFRCLAFLWPESKISGQQLLSFSNSGEESGTFI